MTLAQWLNGHALLTGVVSGASVFWLHWLICRRVVKLAAYREGKADTNFITARQLEALGYSLKRTADIDINNPVGKQVVAHNFSTGIAMMTHWEEVRRKTVKSCPECKRLLVPGWKVNCGKPECDGSNFQDAAN